MGRESTTYNGEGRRWVDSQHMVEIGRGSTYSGEGRRWVEGQHIVEREGGG